MTKNLSEICKQAKQKGYGLAISNPCFEVWLCLHFQDLKDCDTTAKSFKLRLKEICGSYNSSKLDLIQFKPHLNAAIDRAKLLHPEEQSYWPKTPGSHVYRLVEVLVECLKK